MRGAGAGFGVDTNRVTVVDPDGATELPAGSKAEVAHRILDRVVARMAQPNRPAIAWTRRPGAGNFGWLSRRFHRRRRTCTVRA